MYRLEYYDNLRRHCMGRLSAKQRRIVQETFKFLDEDAAKVGLTIYARLLCKHPQYKNIWPQFRAIPDSSLVMSRELQMYSVVFMNAMRYVVDNIDNDEAIEKRIISVAQSHKKWGVYKTHIENVLVELLEVLNNRMRRYDPEVNEAWTVFIITIADLIDEMANRRTPSHQTHAINN